MKSAVFPWTDDLKLTDAFRAPLAEVFPLLEAIQNFQEPNRYFCLIKIEGISVLRIYLDS